MSGGRDSVRNIRQTLIDTTSPPLATGPEEPMPSSMLLASLALSALLAGPVVAQQASHHGPVGEATQADPAALDPEAPLYDNLGTHHYPVTASHLAQRYFDQGLRLTWAFNHAEAIRSFRQGEQLDSACAMCAWGVAFASGPNINAPVEPAGLDTAIAAVRRAQARAAGTSPVEQALIAGLAARYLGPGRDRASLDSAWADAMSRVVERFPDDVEVRVLHADALMNLSPWNYWGPDGTPRPGTRTLLDQLEVAVHRAPNHPGACHLFIHAVEAHDPARALPCAERLAALMPGAGHLVHMPAHIYIRVGRYADAIRANQHAVHADRAYLDGPAGARRGLYASGYYPHNHHFLSFAAAMMGAGRLAIEHAFRAADALDPAVAREVPWIEAITPIGYWTLVTFGRWEQILGEPLPRSDLRFTTGMAYYARGVAFAARRRMAEARAALDTVSAIAAGQPEGDNRTALLIARHALAGEIAMRRGTPTLAVREFQRAVDLEDGMAYTEPPTWYYPMRHSLGKALLAAGLPREAETAYRQDLARFPENGWALYGLWQALSRQGHLAEAREVRQRFERAWAAADHPLTASRF